MLHVIGWIVTYLPERERRLHNAQVDKLNAFQEQHEVLIPLRPFSALLTQNQINWR